MIVVHRPDLNDEELPSAVEKVTRAISEKGGAVNKAEPWGKRRLAYPIKHYLEGNYLLAQFQLEPHLIRDLDAQLKLSDEVLRHLIVKLEPPAKVQEEKGEEPSGGTE